MPSDGAYTGFGTYDHTEMQALVAALFRQSNTPPNVLLELFGQHLTGRFGVSYPDFFKAASTLLDFLASIDRHIHVEVRKLYPDAGLPEFRAERLDNETMHLDYISCRPFEALAAGLIRGAAQTYGEPIRLERNSHVRDGCKFVRFSIERMMPVH